MFLRILAKVQISDEGNIMGRIFENWAVRIAVGRYGINAGLLDFYQL
jgi:hypothetical protein